MALGRKTGGRTKESKKKQDAATIFVLEVERALRAGKVDDSLVNRTCRHIVGDNPAVSWDAIKRMLEMKFGRPKQPVTGEDGGPIQVQIITNTSFPQQ